jgi:hypothetical protein
LYNQIKGMIKKITSISTRREKVADAASAAAASASASGPPSGHAGSGAGGAEPGGAKVAAHASVTESRWMMWNCVPKKLLRSCATTAAGSPLCEVEMS